MRQYVRALVVLASLLAAAPVFADGNANDTDTGHQMTCNGTPAQVGTAPGRESVSVVNPSTSSTTVYIGRSNVSTSTGFPIAPGASYTIDRGSTAQIPLYCVTDGTSLSFYKWEAFTSR